MKKLLAMLVVVTMLIAVVPAIAQSGESKVAAIPACGNNDYSVLGEIVGAFASDYGNLSSAMGSATEATLPGLMSDVSDLQQTWWEISERLPRCSMAYESNLVVSRLLDETLISVALIGAGEYDLASIHIDAITATSLQMTELSETLSGLTE